MSEVRRKERDLRRVTLEMSLKPFTSMEPQAIEAVCAEVLRQWQPLVGMADSCSMLLWIADGSEILTWDGDLRREIEWARYIGFANEECFGHIKDRSDPKIAIPYTEDPARITYGDLQTIVAAFKRVAAERYGVRMEVGATFDAGPEFAYSDFKYKLHPEINRAELGGQYISLKADYTVVCSWSSLKADDVRYAAYPDGIPEGTPFGQFLGRQCASFLPTLGFDYIWFSNGFALSYFPWTYLGANYNGTQLPLADYRELADKIMSFWDAFKRECPDYRTELRGTNYGTGMDLAKDCIPMLELYDKKYIELPPPNSPWGALNFDFGLEMTGYMSRIAHLPGTTYPYRFYANDPWFWQNPWRDLYDREPHDIYCPLSAARVNAEGQLEGPGIVEILTIDTEKGELLEDCPIEIVPHIKRAFKDAPDEPGLLTWVYPFRELHATMAESSGNAPDAFFNDWFVRHAINQGLPVNTVLSTDNLYAMEASAIRKLADTILFTSAFWVKGKPARFLADYVRGGGKVLLYGAVEDPLLLELLNLDMSHGLEGDFALSVNLPEDTIASEAEEGKTKGRLLRHEPLLSGGGLREVVRDSADPYTAIGAMASRNGQERVFAVSRSAPEWSGGRIGWIRGSLPIKPSGVTHLPRRQEPEFADSSVIARYMLAHFGYTLLQMKHERNASAALSFVSRHDNAYLFTGCKQDTSVSLRMRFPDGVPVITGQTAVIGVGAATVAFDRTFHDECRVFVNQTESSRVACRENQPFPTPNKRTVRQITVSNLRGADVTIYPPLAALRSGRVEVKNGNSYLDLSGKGTDNRIRLSDITGTIDISW